MGPPARPLQFPYFLITGDAASVEQPPIYPLADAGEAGLLHLRVYRAVIWLEGIRRSGNLRSFVGRRRRSRPFGYADCRGRGQARASAEDDGCRYGDGGDHLVASCKKPSRPMLRCATACVTLCDVDAAQVRILSPLLQAADKAFGSSDAEIPRDFSAPASRSASRILSRDDHPRALRAVLLDWNQGAQGFPTRRCARSLGSLSIFRQPWRLIV